MTGSRPNPLGEAASKVGAAWAAVSGVVGLLVGYGVLTITQATMVNDVGQNIAPAITGVGAAIAGIMPLVSGLVAAFRTASAGREHVTPMADPRAHDGTRLVPETPPGPTLAGRSG